MKKKKLGGALIDQNPSPVKGKNPVGSYVGLGERRYQLP